MHINILSKLQGAHLQCCTTCALASSKAEQSDRETVQNRARQSIIAPMQCGALCIRVIRAPSRVNDGRLLGVDDTLCSDNISRASHCSHFAWVFLSPSKSVVLWWEWNSSWASTSIRGWNNYGWNCVHLAAIKVWCSCHNIVMLWHDSLVRYYCYCKGLAKYH